MMADKLVDYANSVPPGWHFNLQRQAASSISNFYLSHLTPRRRERYDNAIARHGAVRFHAKGFARIFFLASATPLPEERLTGYALKWMDQRAKRSGLDAYKSRLKVLFSPSQPHVSIPNDVGVGLLREAAQACGLISPTVYTAGLFCGSAFFLMVADILDKTLYHPNLHADLALRAESLKDPEVGLKSLLPCFRSQTDGEYIAEGMSDTTLELLRYVEIIDEADHLTPSAPPLRTENSRGV